MGAPHSETLAALLGPAWGSASLRPVSRFLLFGLCSIFLVTLTSDNWAISTAHLPGNAEAPTADGPAPSFSSSFVPVHSKPKVSQATEDVSNSARNADDTRTLEILSNLYTHMQKYQHNSPSVALTSPSSEPNSTPNQDHNQLLAIQEFLNNMDQTAKPAPLKVPNYAVNFKKNGKTMNADELSKGGSGTVPGSTVDQTVQATPYYSPQSDSNGNGSGPSKQLKHTSPYTSMTAAASEQQRVEETTRDEAQMVNKFLANLGPPPVSVQRKGLSNEVKASGIISGSGVGPPMASSVTDGMPSEGGGLYELLASIDGRVQKLQDSLMYYRNSPKPSMVHSSLNPIFTNYLSLIKAQVLNIESTIEAKFSNIEHKFSNVEIEDGIWKKTINWKLEEITSKLSQNENKLSFSNDQILNKLDLVERNFQIVTNDFFSKFLLVNEKLNKIELTLQTKLNDLEAKLRNSFTADNSFKVMQKMSGHGLYKPTEIIEQSMPEHNFKEAALPVQTFQPEKTFVSSKATTPSSNQVTESMTGSTTRKNVDQSEKGAASGAAKLTWNKASMLKTNNTVASLSDRIKFAQRFLKLINAKTNQTLLTKSKFNSTTILDSLKASAEAAKQNGGFQNDAPIVEPTKSVNTSVQSDFAGTSFDQLSGQMNNTAKQSNDKPTAPAKLASQDNYRLMQAETAAPLTTPSAPKKDITQAGGFNNRNLDGLASINYQEVNRGNAGSGGYLQLRGKPENSEANRNTAKCNELRSIFTNIPRESQQESKFYSLCYKMLESNGSSSSLHDLVMASSLDRETNTQMDSRGAPLEKRELNEEISYETPRESPPSLSESRPTTTLLDETNSEIKMDRMDDLDSKLQFFSTKIIKIVQEMWLSSQASENYLKQSLQVANKTQILLKDGFEKLQLAVKPVNQMNQLAEEIREPIINRLQELSTALNNSVEVILNTQAEFITRVLQTDEELKVYEVLDYFINEYRNKSSNGLLQIQNSLHQQSGQFNRSLEFLLLKLETVSKKTIEGVRSETLKVLDNVKDDLHSQISSLSISAHTGSSTRNRPMDSHSQQGECFISRKEFATFCLDGSKMFGTVETVPVSHQQGDTTGGEAQHPVVTAEEELANHELHPHELSHMTEPLTPILTPKRVLPTDMERFNGNNGTLSTGEITEINNGNES